MTTRSVRWAILAGLLIGCWLPTGVAFGLTGAEVELDAGAPTAVTSPEGSGAAAAPSPGEVGEAAEATDEAASDAASAAFEAGPDPLFDDDEAFEELDREIYDPLEGMNRTFFGLNRWVDRLVWKPVTKGYQFIVPEPGRKAVRRFFLNLGSAPIFVNDLLQLRVKDAGVTLGRFLINSTLGMGGLFDAAIEAGWEAHHSDFGQTLALTGVGPGPYLVLPVLGPTTIRDGFGVIVDRAFEPLTYIFGFGLLGPSIQLMIGAGNGIATREEYLDELERLEESSVDYYAAIRSVYLQNREAEIWSHLEPPVEAGVAR